jgi:hypothetical protein
MTLGQAVAQYHGLRLVLSRQNKKYRASKPKRTVRPLFNALRENLILDVLYFCPIHFLSPFGFVFSICSLRSHFCSIKQEARRLT